jgi:hypothetical protein
MEPNQLFDEFMPGLRIGLFDEDRHVTLSHIAIAT